MTAAEAKEIVARRIVLKNPALRGLMVDVDVDARDMLIIRCGYFVPDRERGEQTKIFNIRAMPWRDDMPEEYLLLAVEDHIRSVFHHEFAEAFHRDGVRVRDPHEGDQ